jgi:type I restriction enzyme S subunit
MAGEYHLGRVGDVAESISDTHPMTKASLVFLNTSDILHGKFLHRNYTAVKEWPGQAKKSIKRDDILFSEIRPANGRWAFVDEDADDFVVSTKLMVIRSARDKVLPKYLYLFLTSRENTLWLQHLAESRSGTFPQITFDQEASLDIPLPPLPEQKRIAHILGTLDDKIDLNRRMNATLEGISRAIFKSWFVDFDPVRQKAAGKQPVGMDAQTAAMFPDSFEDSEIGEVPKGWQVTRASDLYEVAIGKTPPRKEPQWFTQSPDDVPWISIKDLGEAGAFILSVSEYLTAAAVEKFRVRRIPDGTVVLSFKLTVGRVAITDGEMLSNEAIAHFLLLGTESPEAEFLFCYLKQFDYGRLGSTSSIATAVNSESVRSIPVIVPSKPLAASFCERVRPWFRLVRELQRHTRTLAALRDTLLPKLLSGEIRIPEAEQTLHEATA